MSNVAKVEDRELTIQLVIDYCIVACDDGSGVLPKGDKAEGLGAQRRKPSLCSPRE